MWPQVPVQRRRGIHLHSLRCDKCGGGKEIAFEEIGEPHRRFVKGLSVPYSGVTAAEDREIQDNYSGEPLSEEEYHREVEKIVGGCDRGGRFKFDAPVRCSKCKSPDFENDRESLVVCLD